MKDSWFIILCSHISIDSGQRLASTIEKSALKMSLRICNSLFSYRWFLGGASWGANLPEKLSFVIWEVRLLCDQISVCGWNGRLVSIFHMFVIDRSSLEILVLFCQKLSVIWFPWTWTWYIMYVLPILWVLQFDQICKHFSWCFA